MAKGIDQSTVFFLFILQGPTSSNLLAKVLDCPNPTNFKKDVHKKTYLQMHR